MELIYTLLLSNMIELIKVFFIIVASLLAYIQFVSANAFKRAQYLSELWRKFYTTEKFVNIYKILESENADDFKEISSVDVYNYLAYLEEIAIFAKNNRWEFHKINKKEILNLFQFHFYYIYQNEVTKKMFWSKIISFNEIDKEISQFYWRRQYLLSIDAKQIIDTNTK